MEKVMWLVLGATVMVASLRADRLRLDAVPMLGALSLMLRAERRHEAHEADAAPTRRRRR